jgi:hypothetical protein
MRHIATTTLILLQNATKTEPFAWFGLAGHVDPQLAGQGRTVAAWQAIEAPIPGMLSEVLREAAELAPDATSYDLLGSDTVAAAPAPHPFRAKIMTMASSGTPGAVQLAIIPAPPQGLAA